MKVSLVGVSPELELRDHPYTHATYDERVRHYRLVEDRTLIRKGVLEDFVPYESFDGVQTFYDFLDWINGPESKFESSDCRLRASPIADSTSYQASLLQGRIMIFYRELQRNLVLVKPENHYDASDDIKELITGLVERLHEQKVENPQIQISLYLAPIRYLEITHDQKMGQQLWISFDCLGESEEKAFDNFGLMVNCLSRAFKSLNLCH